MSQEKTYEARECDGDPCDLCCFWQNPCMDPNLNKDFSEVAKAMHQTDRACGTVSRVYFVDTSDVEFSEVLSFKRGKE